MIFSFFDLFFTELHWSKRIYPGSQHFLSDIVTWSMAQHVVPFYTCTMCVWKKCAFSGCQAQSSIYVLWIKTAHCLHCLSILYPYIFFCFTYLSITLTVLKNSSLKQLFCEFLGSTYLYSVCFETI